MTETFPFPTMADRFEQFFRAAVPLMARPPTHFDAMQAYFAGACECATMLAEIHQNDTATPEQKADAQDQLLGEIFGFAQVMVDQIKSTQQDDSPTDEGDPNVQPQ